MERVGCSGVSQIHAKHELIARDSLTKTKRGLAKPGIELKGLSGHAPHPQGTKRLLGRVGIASICRSTADQWRSTWGLNEGD